MALRLRFARFGRTKRPFYAIVVSENTSPRDSNFLEKLGSYDPMTKQMQINKEKIEYWLNHGALPTDSVAKLLKNDNEICKKVFDLNSQHFHKVQTGSKKKAE